MSFIKKIFFFLLTFCISFPSIAQVKDAQLKRTYYISSSLGDDANDGLTEATPKQHISSVEDKRYVCFRLKCDDIFYENFDGYKYCIVESYSSGQKPVLCGFKVLRNPNAWIYDPINDYWIIDLTKDEDFFGYMKSPRVINERLNNVGMIYDPSTDRIYGHNVNALNRLKENGDFYTNSSYQEDSVKVHPFGRLYFKSSKDPRTMINLCFSMADNAFKQAEGMVIRDIAVVGFACHGVANGWWCSISNCQFDMIGGAIQVGYKYWVRYGNGIEFAGNTHDNLVENCLISRTYDCGVTIQGPTTKELQPKNIHFRKNRFYHCRQAFEHFISSSGNYEAEYINCSFEDNVCFEMGHNEFSSPEKRDANILSYEKKSRTLDINNNMFFGASHLCAYNYNPGMRDNQIYIYKDQYLNHYHGIANFETIFASSFKQVAKYKQRTDDNSKVVILKRNTAKSKRVSNSIKSLVDWQPVNLSLQKS